MSTSQVYDNAYVQADNEYEALRATNMRQNNAKLVSLNIDQIPAATVKGSKRKWRKPVYEKSRSSNRVAKQDVEVNIQDAPVQRKKYSKLTYGGNNEIEFGSPEHFKMESDFFALSISEVKHFDNTVRCQAVASGYTPNQAEILMFITEIMEMIAKAQCQEKKQRFGPWNNTSVCYVKLMEYCLAELNRLRWLDYIYSAANNNQTFRIFGVITGALLLLKASLYTFLTREAGEKPL